MQDLSEESVRNWYSWAGGSARACLRLNSKQPDGLEAWIDKVTPLLAQGSTADLLVRTDIWSCLSCNSIGEC